MAFTFELSPGEDILLTVEPGHYTVSATAGGGQNQGQGQGQGSGQASPRQAVVEGSPQVVEACGSDGDPGDGDPGDGPDDGLISGEVTVTRNCLDLGAEYWHYGFLFENDTNVPVTGEWQAYSGDTLLYTAETSLIHPDGEVQSVTNQHFFDNADVTHVVFAATSESGAPVTVVPARLDYPADFEECGLGGPHGGYDHGGGEPGDGGGDDGSITGEVTVTLHCEGTFTVEGVEYWYYTFRFQNDTDVPATGRLEVYQNETLRHSGTTGLIQPGSYGQQTTNEHFFEFYPVTHVELTAASETGEPITVTPSRMDYPADFDC